MLNFKQYVSISSQINETFRDLQTFRFTHAKKCTELEICKCQLHRRNMAMKLFRFPTFGVGVFAGIGGGGRLGRAVVPILVEFFCFDLWGEGVRFILLSTGESSDRWFVSATPVFSPPADPESKGVGLGIGEVKSWRLLFDLIATDFTAHLRPPFSSTCCFSNRSISPRMVLPLIAIFSSGIV